MKVFVFGSNFAGKHGAGSAKEAYQNHGARWHSGYGFHGRSYAIPTKDRNLQVLPLERIEEFVKDFIAFAKATPNWEYDIVRIGTGLAGYKWEQIAPFFEGMPPNCKIREK